MFTKQQNFVSQDTPSIIAKDLLVKGNIESDGMIEVEGVVEGNVNSNQLTIRKNGIIRGDIKATQVIIDGSVYGNVVADTISISETGKIIGTLSYTSLAVKDGAYIDAKCTNTIASFDNNAANDAILSPEEEEAA